MRKQREFDCAAIQSGSTDDTFHLTMQGVPPDWIIAPPRPVSLPSAEIAALPLHCDRRELPPVEPGDT